MGSLTVNFQVNTATCAVGTIHSGANLSSYNAATVSIQNDLDVVGSIVLDQCDVYISPLKKITVKTGSQLTIKGSWLHGCSCPWEGIVVEPGAKLFISNASVIEDANTAITSLATNGTNIINIANSLFNKCKIGIDLIASPSISMNNNLIVRKSIFTCRNIASNTIYNNISNYNALHANFVITADLDTQSPLALSFTNQIDNVATKTTLTNGNRSHIGLKLSSHTISTINPLREVNIFDNMDYGVYAEVSSVKIVGAQFMNMPGNNIQLDGIGVFSIDRKNEDLNSECTVERCQVNDVCRAIHVENIINVTAIGNIISSNTTTANYNLSSKKPGQYGIYYSFFARTSASLIVPTTWLIKGNSIRNYLYGTAIIRNNYLGNSQSEFRCNTIFGASPATGNPNGSYCIVGLYINDGVGGAGVGVGGPSTNPELTGGEFHIAGNDIVRVRKHAIEFINVKQNTIIEKNQNSLSNSAFGAYIMNSYGPLGLALRDNNASAATISLTDCRNILIWWNSITGYTLASSIAAINTTGIKCIRSQVRILRNTIARNKNDIWFYDNCTPSLVAQNRFFLATNAMYFSNNAQIGQQGNATSPAANIFTSAPFSARVIWQTNMANASIPPSFSTFFWSNVGFLDEKMLNANQTISGPATNTLRFNNGPGGGLVRIQLNAGLIADPPTFCSDPTPIPPPPPILDPILTNLQDSINYTKTLILDDLSTQQYAAEKWWHNKLEALRLIESNVPMLAQDAVIAAFYSNNQQNDLGKLNQVYSLANAGYTQLAASINSTVTGIEINENYRKVLNYIHLALVNDSVLSIDSTTINSLELIANACPEMYGKVVYEARNILMGLKKQVIEFDDICDLQNNARSINTNFIKSETFALNQFDNYTLYPNPNNGLFELNNKTGKAISGKYLVTDLLGKHIMEQFIKVESSIAIDLTEYTLKPGVYFVKLLSENNEVIYVGKVIIQ